MELSFSQPGKSFLQALGRVQRQIPFATSQALNDTAFDNEWSQTVTANHQPPACRGGDCPDQMHGRYLGPYSDGNEMGLTGWHAVAARAGAGWARAARAGATHTMLRGKK